MSLGFYYVFKEIDPMGLRVFFFTYFLECLFFHSNHM